MRQWHTNTELMCREHLLGEHVEHHMFVGSINKGIDVSGYIRDGLLNINTLHERHEEIVQEMLRRGYNHKSPLPEIDQRQLLRYVDLIPCIPSEISNLQELARRCTTCREIQHEVTRAHSIG